MPEVEFTAEFKRNLRQLAKKYRRLKSDLQPLIAQLQEGRQPGDRVPGTASVVFKVRAANSDSNRGKRGGYRVIYSVRAESVLLVTVYSKADQGDISASQIRRILE